MKSIDPQVFNIALNILTGILIAAISSWITVQLSLRRFRAEKWWERKADAYSKIIEALHNAKSFSDHFLDVEIEGRKLPEEREKELRSRAKAASDEILKTMDVGAFLLSDEALSRLRQYQKDADAASNEPAWFLYLEAEWAAADKCLKEIIDIAKKDLKTN
jgi:hypothetical protein